MLLVIQAALGARVVARLWRTAGGERILASEASGDADRAVSVILPVLDERRRAGACLEGLLDQGSVVGEILVVDGGSRDRTQELVLAYRRRDPRVRLLDASPVPSDWNGKAWGLQVGLEAASPAADWVLTIDADVRPSPPLARSLLAHARARGLRALGVATRQDLSGPAEGLLHPAYLTTLVYRLGMPGRATARIGEVQANGQCSLFHRETLRRGGGFRVARASRCEDVTLARSLAAAGQPVGFYETADLVSVRMYEGWQEAWRNWPRSLPLRDQYVGARSLVGLLEVLFVQALPLPLLLACWWVGGPRRGLILNLVLAALRAGVLLGTARAYVWRPWTYWFSPLCDIPVAVQLWLSAPRRRYTWRGRPLVNGEH